jgi:hypothetical protein
MPAIDQTGVAPPTDSGNRHSTIWKVTLTILIAIVVVRIILVAVDIGAGSASSTALWGIVILVTMASIFIVPLQMIRSFSVAQYNAVVSANPDAVVIPASRAPFTRWALHFLGKHINLPLFQTWVLTKTGMQVWKGGRRARALTTVPWSEIQYVSENDNIRLGSGSKKSSAVVIQRVNYMGEFSFFLRTPARPMYPAPMSEVQRAVALIEPHILPRDN